jgi:protease PrsW
MNANEKPASYVNKPHAGFWRASLVQIIGMTLLAAVVAYGAQFIGPLSRPAQIAVGIVLAVVPSALWLWYFYRQDRLEPEPKTRIAAVFLLALLLTDVLARRIIYQWFDVLAWASADLTTSVLASILINGFVYQAITYVAVRLVVYSTDEFDERMDGIVYGTVAGLGIATLLNLRYIVDNAGVALAPGVVRVATTALAQASFSGLMGYFMAEAKFDQRPVWWVPLGITVTAICNGVLSWLIGEVSASGLNVNPFRSLLMGVLVALTAFFALTALMSRTTPVTLRRGTARRGG